MRREGRRTLEARQHQQIDWHVHLQQLMGNDLNMLWLAWVHRCYISIRTHGCGRFSESSVNKGCIRYSWHELKLISKLHACLYIIYYNYACN